jgi:cytochrome c-type biogenesis protein CcmH
VLLLALVLAAPAAASERHPTLGELEGEVMCPTCKTTLDQSNAPIANRIRQFISARIAAGDTESEIKAKLVAQFGPAILAEPSKHGFNLLAWVLPFVALGVGAAALGWLVWRWSRGRERSPAAAGGPPIDPELDRRVDEELARFDG